MPRNLPTTRLHRLSCRVNTVVGFFIAVIYTVFCPPQGHAEATEDVWMELARSNHVAATAAAAASPSDTTLAWKLGRACFDLAEFATKDDQRERLAEQGIATCRAALKTEPASAPLQYYLAMNLGQLARTKTLGALKLVREMEALFSQARLLDETFDAAGPDRCLALLYLEAPGWPTSIGNKKKALTHIRRAVQLAPTYPGNQLSLVKILIQNHDWSAAETEWASLVAAWEANLKAFTGPEWGATRQEWESSRTSLERRLEQRRRSSR